MMRTICTLALVGLLLPFAPNAQAKGSDDFTALNVAPVGAKFGFATRGLNTHAYKTRMLRSYMKRVGLNAPNFARIVEEIAKEADASNGKNPWPESMGLAENGVIAAYGVMHDGKPEAFVVMDVEYKKDFIRFMRRRVETQQWVEPGKKPKRATVDRKAVKGGIDQFTVRLQGKADGQPVLTVRFKNGVAALSETVEPLPKRRTNVLDHVAWSGTPIPPAFRQISADREQLTLAFWAKPSELAGEHDPELAFLQAVSGAMTIDASGVHIEGAITLSEEAKPFVAIAKPGSTGSEARATMVDVAAGAPLWGRFSLSTEEALRLVRKMAGKGFTKEVKKLRKELGFDPIKDLAQIVTGDVLVTCHDGLTDCVLALGITKPTKAERTTKALLDMVSKSEKTLHFETDRKAVRGAPKGSVLATTTVFEQAVGPRGRPDRNAERADIAQFSWGVRPGLLIFGLSPQGVSRALVRVAGPDTEWPLGGGNKGQAPIGFGETTTFASYQVVGEPSTTLRQLLPLARHHLPSGEWTGIAARLGDAFMTFQDQMTYGASTIRGKGLTWHYSASGKTLPSSGQPGYDKKLASSYEAALKHRYQGRIRSSNEALLALSNAAPESPWGKKARLLALGGDGSALSALSTFGTLGAMLGVGFERFARKVSKIKHPDVGETTMPVSGP